MSFYGETLLLLNIAFACMALTIYHEARGEPLAGQVMVAQVLYNRADHNIERVCHETLKPKQFSWTNDLVVYRHKKPVLQKDGEPTDEKAWKQSVMIAREILTGRVPDMTGGATYYHARRVAPTWRMQMVRTKSIGHHVFYRNV